MQTYSYIMGCVLRVHIEIPNWMARLVIYDGKQDEVSWVLFPRDNYKYNWNS